MDIHERLKILRNRLKLSTRAFGKSVGLSGSVISNMENKRRNITERTVKDICREFNVNPDWLNNGCEPMFIDIFEDLDLADDVKDLAEIYSNLSTEDKSLVKKLVLSLGEKTFPYNS